MKEFLSDIAKIRQRARQHMEQGPITASHKADRARVIAVLNEALATEIESYSEIIRWLGNDDPTTRSLMEAILKVEEEHADDLSNMLATLDSARAQTRGKSV